MGRETENGGTGDQRTSANTQVWSLVPGPWSRSFVLERRLQLRQGLLLAEDHQHVAGPEFGLPARHDDDLTVPLQQQDTHPIARPQIKIAEALSVDPRADADLFHQQVRRELQQVDDMAAGQTAGDPDGQVTLAPASSVCAAVPQSP